MYSLDIATVTLQYEPIPTPLYSITSQSFPIGLEKLSSNFVLQFTFAVSADTLVELPMLSELYSIKHRCARTRGQLWPLGRQ
ncbi:hypothetical protein [Thermus phage TSP4]|nr:hypothetical protein [Thermus phage TSP4]